MSKLAFLILLFCSPFSNAGNTLAEVARRCPGPANAPALYSSDFKWGFGYQEMLDKAVEIYHSAKRLPRQAYVDSTAKQIVLPYDDSHGGNIVVRESFINAISSHIEAGLKAKTVDAVFFPDMGHSHLLIPQEVMAAKYDSYPVSNYAGMYREMFRDEQIKILYHTAEQLKVLDESDHLLPDAKLKWRHQTRNLLGENNLSGIVTYLQNPSSKANTSNGLPGYFWWGAGFNLSANQAGCFSYQHNGQTFYYDISMYDLEGDPANSEGFDQ